MQYDKDKVDEVTLALICLVMSKTREGGGRASKGFDLQTLERLQQKGWISASRIKDLSLEITAAGVSKAEEFFKKHFAL